MFHDKCFDRTRSTAFIKQDVSSENNTVNEELVRHIIVSTEEYNLSICNQITGKLDVVEEFHRLHALGDRYAECTSF